MLVLLVMFILREEGVGVGVDDERFMAVLGEAEEVLADLSRVRDRLSALSMGAPWVEDRRFTGVADAADGCEMAHESLAGFVRRGRWVPPTDDLTD